MNDEMEEFEERDVIEETSLNGELKYVQDQLAKCRAKKLAIEENIKKLEEQKKTQPCSYQEKLALEKKVELLSSKMTRSKEKIEHAKNIKISMDEKLTEERNKVIKFFFLRTDDDGKMVGFTGIAQ